jgi:translocation and assembly module TamB
MTLHARARFARALRLTGRVFVWAVSALLVLAFAAFLSLNLAPMRREIALRTTSLLAGTFRGSLIVEEIEHISPFEVRLRSARMLDGQGRQTLQVRSVAVQLSAFDIVQSVLWGDGDVEILLREVTVDYVDLSLDDDGTDLPRIARAFEPKEPTEAPRPQESPSRGVAVNGPDVRIRHAWVHGKMAGVPLIDVDADDVRATARVDAASVTARLQRGVLTTRALPRGADLRGKVSAAVMASLDDDAVLELEGRFEGSAGGSTSRIIGEDKFVD